MGTVAAYDVLNRITFVFTSTLYMLAIAAACIACSSIIIDIVSPPQPMANFTTITNGHLFRAHKRNNIGNISIIDRTIVFINGSFDFTSCFNWNTRLIFVMFVCEYKTANYPRNEVTVLDKTITSVEEAIFELHEAAKYPFDDITVNTLAKNPSVNVIVKYHAMMNSGWSPLRIVPPENGGKVKVNMPTFYRQGTGDLYYR